MPSGLIEADRLIFLICTPRSGSTVFAHALSKASGIYSPAEPWVMLAIEQFGRINPRHEFGAWHVARAVDAFLADGPDPILATMARAAYGATLPAGKTHLLDKTPAYFWIIDFIQRVLPKAQLPVLVRNPLAVAASFKSTWGMDLSVDGLLHNTDIMLSQFFTATERVFAFAEAQRRTRPELVVDYDEFTFRPEATVDRLLGALGFDPANKEASVSEIDPSHLSRTGFGDRKILSTNKVHSQSRGDWRAVLSDEEAALVINYFDLQGPGLDRLRGYGGAEDRAEALRDYLTETLEARKSDYRRSYEHRAYDPTFNDDLHALYEDLADR